MHCVMRIERPTETTSLCGLKFAASECGRVYPLAADLTMRVVIFTTVKQA